MNRHSNTWVPVSVEAQKTCDKTSWGMSPKQGEDGRCGKPAAWTQDIACNCGAIHSTFHLCHEHRISDLQDELKRKDETVKMLVRAVRERDLDLRTDDEALLRAHGIDVYPRPKPDEFWRAHHPGVEVDAKPPVVS